MDSMMVAPLTSANSGACSSTLTVCPFLARATAVASPPRPAPTTVIFNFIGEAADPLDLAFMKPFRMFRSDASSTVLCLRNSVHLVG